MEPTRRPTKEAIKFEAELRKFTTLVDGSASVTINIPEYEKEAKHKIMDLIAEAPIVYIAVVPGEIND